MFEHDPDLKKALPPLLSKIGLDWYSPGAEGFLRSLPRKLV